MIVFVWLWFAALVGISKAVQIVLPQCILIFTQIIQVFPRIQTAVMTVIEADFEGVTADRCDIAHADIYFADLQHFLSRSVPAYFGRR